MRRRREGGAGDGSFKERRILVDRVDRDTIALARFLNQRGAHVVLATDRNVPVGLGKEIENLEASGVAVSTNANREELAVQSDIVFAHDYTSPCEPFIQMARTGGKVVTQLADLILETAPGPVVGVTGSAGKSTTATLIANALENSSVTVHLSREHYLADSPSPNREHLELLEQMRATDVTVLELTSSHLEYMNNSPSVAVITRVWPDHIEWHGTLDRYLTAKARIFEFQGENDWAVINGRDEISRRCFAPLCRGRTITVNDPTSPFGVFRKDAMLFYTWEGIAEPLLRVGDVRIAPLYLDNAMAAAGAALAAGGTTDGIRRALREFRGLSGRLEVVAETAGVRVVNDSIALTPNKARAGLETFADESVILISGGRESVDGWSIAPLHSSSEEERAMQGFCEAARRKVKRAFIIGSAGDRLATALVDGGLEPARIERLNDLEEATTAALRSADPGSAVLLAPVFDPGPDAGAVFVAAVHRQIAAWPSSP